MKRLFLILILCCSPAISWGQVPPQCVCHLAGSGGMPPSNKPAGYGKANTLSNSTKAAYATSACGDAASGFVLELDAIGTYDFGTTTSVVSFSGDYIHGKGPDLQTLYWQNRTLAQLSTITAKARNISVRGSDGTNKYDPAGNLLSTTSSIVKGNGTGGVTAATAGTDYFAPNLVHLYHTGHITTYTTISGALAVAADGDEIQATNGTYTETSTLDFSLGGTATVNFFGQSRDGTIINTSVGANATLNACVHPGLTKWNSGHYTINCNATHTTPNGTYQCPLGALANDAAFTNAYVHDIAITNDSDGIYFNIANCSMIAERMLINTNFDAVALIGGAGNSLTLKNSIVNITGPTSCLLGVPGAAERSSLIASGTGVVLNIINNDITITDATNGGDVIGCQLTSCTGTIYNNRFTLSNSSGSGNCYGVSISGTSPVAFVSGNIFETSVSGGGVAYDLKRATGQLQVNRKSCTGSGTSGALVTNGTITDAVGDGILLTGTAGSTLNVGTGGTLGTSAYISSTAGGDLSGTLPSPTVAKVNGVTYGSSPSTNTVPVVTGTNAITYEAVPNAALANSAITIAGSSTSLGGSITRDSITGVSSNGYLKRTGSNTLTNIADPLPVANGGTANDNSTTTYTPTITNGSNVSSSAAYTTYYFRLGSYVHVWGKVDITHTNTNTLTTFNISLPVASTIGNEYELAGIICGNIVGGAQAPGRIYGDNGSNNAGVWIRPVASGGLLSYSFQFDYIVH